PVGSGSCPVRVLRGSGSTGTSIASEASWSSGSLDALARRAARRRRVHPALAREDCQGGASERHVDRPPLPGPRWAIGFVAQRVLGAEPSADPRERIQDLPGRGGGEVLSAALVRQRLERAVAGRSTVAHEEDGSGGCAGVGKDVRGRCRALL